jgi:hypothetical protein
MVTTYDPAGSAIHLSRAVDRCSPHECRLVTTKACSPFEFEADIHVPDLTGFDELEEILKEADLFHFHLDADEHLSFGPFAIADFLRGQAIVHHHHGEPSFRDRPGDVSARELALKRRALVSTPELLTLYPEATWIPNALPLTDPDFQPVYDERDRGSLVIGHAPSCRKSSRTKDLEWCVNNLRNRSKRIRSRIIEQTPHHEYLQLMGACDLSFDHMGPSYSFASLETMSMGIPTIAGLDTWTLNQIQSFTGSEQNPWVIARDRSELIQRIETLACDASLREAIGRKSRDWLLSYWNETRIASALSLFYEDL